jgi:hypothetical protein
MPMMRKKRPGASVTLRVVLPPRYILIARDNGDPVAGDTAMLMGDWRKYFHPLPRRLTPIWAARLIQSGICDFYPYEYRKVARDDPAAGIDVYLAAPDWSRDKPDASVERDCKYATALARVYPTCIFCGGPMRHGEESPWLYGYDAEPVGARADRCCSACHAAKVVPAQEAERAAEEARCRAEEAALEAACR